MLKYLCLMCMSINCIWSLYAEIIETKNFRQITDYSCPGTLFIIDIDDTILIPVQSLGTDVWFLSRLKHYNQLYKDQGLALDQSLAEWEAIRHLTKIKLVEEGTDVIIKRMQEQQIPIMGLTTQGLALAHRTIVQLRSIAVDLSTTAPSREDYYFMNGKNGVLYREGVLFTAGTDKGEALIKYLDQIDYHPNRIVFINDKRSHLEDLQKSVEPRDIAFVGLRYSYSDQRVSEFSNEIAEIQWRCSTLQHLLSDQEAQVILNAPN